MMSGLVEKAKQAAHLPHASPLIGFKQFIVLANTLAVDVFPVPLGPVNK